jgi:hypothetical protein
LLVFLGVFWEKNFGTQVCGLWRKNRQGKDKWQIQGSFDPLKMTAKGKGDNDNDNNNDNHNHNDNHNDNHNCRSLGDDNKRTGNGNSYKK